MTIHYLNDPNADTFYSTNDAANGDTFDVTANSIGMSLWNLSSTNHPVSGQPRQCDTCEHRAWPEDL